MRSSPRASINVLPVSLASRSPAVTRAGARLILNYDAASQSFVGTVANTTSGVLSNVRIEVHLSNGTELGPTTPIDLVPGDVIPVTLPAPGEIFDTWTAHPEVGSQGAGWRLDAVGHRRRA